MTAVATLTSSDNVVLQVKDVHKYFGGIAALQGVSFTVAEHQVKAIIGPNGAGKTTVFNLISGLYPANEGEIWFNNTRLDGHSAHRICQAGIARTFQSAQVFANMSILENVMVGCHTWTKSAFFPCLFRTRRSVHEERRIRAYAQELLDYVGVQADRASPPSGIPFQQQRLVEIARALATRPRLVLLDEPAAGLNARESVQLGTLIRKICESGITVLLVEHDMDLVMDISDHIAVLDFGRVIARGTPRQVRSNPEVIATYLGEDIGAAD